MQTFELEGHDFIELNKLLKIMQVAGSGGEAKQLIDEGLISVNGETEKQRRKKLRKGDKVTFKEQEIEIC
ncbi:RNA-binding S4 domain-containing protein [Ekhidna sp.]|uniref:RNA-binding S4 domain-containing protein n=1 Tax=Ekhidna sp. TaxID=2608089 RepID=UPI003299FE44